MKVAIFDFDHTLVHQESLWLYVRLVCGPVRSVFLVITTLLEMVFRPRMSDGWKTQFKVLLLRRALRGRSLHSLRPLAGVLKTHLTLKDDVVQSLHDHHKQRHHIVIVSGALDIYLPELLRLMVIPYDIVFCTHMEVQNQYLTGNIQGKNCVRDTKKEIIQKYFKTLGYISESWGYGNWPDDQPMLSLVDHPCMV